MKKGDHKISVTKTNDIWKCSLRELLTDSGNAWELKNSITADSFPELMVEIGNKKWIYLINKNFNNE